MFSQEIFKEKARFVKMMVITKALTPLLTSFFSWKGEKKKREKVSFRSERNAFSNNVAIMERKSV